MNQIEDGNWDTEVVITGFVEVRHLGTAIKQMAMHIKKLMADIVAEQELKRRNELTILQNQINPHFLYNTLDIIVWMIENERKTEAVRVVTALARFFRISLSKGKNIVTVLDEIEHVRNYLMIQEMRYKNKFTYTIHVSEEAKSMGTIKLVLQPLVENAIYHACEFMDGDGEIKIRVWVENEQLKFMISDNGCGMTEEKVENLVTGGRVDSKKGSGLGFRNVHDRVQIVFGEGYGLTVRSEPDEGTDIFITMPAVLHKVLVERGMR